MPDAPLQPPSPRLKKSVLLFLTVITGWMGGHRFHLGRNFLGSVYLLFFWTFVPMLVSLLELIVFAFTSEERLNEKYAVRLQAPWVMLLALAVLAAYVALGLLSIRSFNDYRTRSLAMEGMVAANRLKAEILETYRSKGASDMRCDAARCPFSDMANASFPHVRAFRSDRGGIITVELADTVVPAPRNRLVFKPFIDGKPADLSDPRNAGGIPVWQCGGDASTTVDERHRPSNCR